MTVANRGTKRRCPHCAAAFYDLARQPVVCPKCHTPYVESPRIASRAPARPRAEPPQPAARSEDEIAAFDEDEILEREEVEQDEAEEDADDDDTEERE